MRYLLLSILLIPMAASAQFNISFNTGIAYFNMADVKRYQTSQTNRMPVHAKVISSFPAYWCYNGTAKWILDNGIMIGADVAYTSTGGRVSYSDFSGKITFDQTLLNISLSTFAGKAFRLKDNSLTLQCYVMTQTTFTDYQDQYSEQSQIGGNDSHSFGGISHYIQPVVNLSKRFGLIAVNMNIGYSKLITDGDLTGLYDEPQSNDLVITADWSGLRLGCGVSLYFYKMKQEQIRR
jgi:hypothetical protein